MTQAIVNPLQTVIGELKNISPEITNCFIFEKNGEVLACSEDAVGKQSKNLISALNSLSEHAQVIGGIKTLTIQGANSQLNIIATNNRYLTTVSTRSANEKTVKSLTHVIIPTVMELIQQRGSEETKAAVLPEPVKLDVEPIQPASPVKETPHNDITPQVSASYSSEPSLPKAPASQFMVEKISGFMVASDTVRVDSDVIAKWSYLYGDKQILEVHIETLEGKKTSCKFKPIKESNGKGAIQIPEKILQTLQTSKGKLVIVKPVITQPSEDIAS